MTPMTRKELVLRLLRENEGQWVDGPRIASAEVGGSEGLKRLRELRQDGYDIRMRKHPDPRRDIFQYKLMPSSENPTRGDFQSPGTRTPPPASSTPGMAGRVFPLKRNDDGSIEIEWKVCDECGGRYAIEQDHLRGEEHVRWQQLHQTIEWHVEIEQAPPPPAALFYTEDPKGVAFGEAVICPRCKGVRRPKRRRLVKGAYKWYEADDFCMDPRDHTKVCARCNGWGIVPNQGVVETANLRPTKAEQEAAPVEEAPSEGAFE